MSIDFTYLALGEDDGRALDEVSADWVTIA
jgi:hypothetical protein